MTGAPLFRRRYTRPGAPPGTFTIPDSAPTPVVRAMVYNAQSLDERSLVSGEDFRAVQEEGKVAWIDVQGLGDEALLREMADVFRIHPLALADIVNIGQRPKAEAYGDRLFIVTRMVRADANGEPDWEQVSLFIGAGFVVTFQERPGDVLDPLRTRIRTEGSRIRASGSDYLACMVVDAIVDGYFPVLESFGERLERIEEQLISEPGQDLLEEIFRAKRDLMSLRRAIWPQREMLTRLLRDSHPLFVESTTPYLRDVYDHVIHIVDVTETYREMAQSYIDVYLSSIANRTNEVMRVLTVMATIFIPMTFIAGVYGMNFDLDSPFNMPELEWAYGYPFFWTLCLIVVVVMLYVARRLGWIGGTKGRRSSSV